MFLEQLYSRLLSEGKEPLQQKTSAFVETGPGESSPTWSSLPHSGCKLACWLKRINFLAEGRGRTNRQTGLPLLCSFTLIHLHSSLGKCIILFYMLNCVCLCFWDSCESWGSCSPVGVDTICLSAGFDPVRPWLDAPLLSLHLQGQTPSTD